jgi:hypothetical protein
MKTTQPPEDARFMLIDKTLKLRVDYRIAGRIEDELKRIFVCEELSEGGLNVLAYQNPTSKELKTYGNLNQS